MHDAVQVLSQGPLCGPNRAPTPPTNGPRSGPYRLGQSIYLSPYAAAAPGPGGNRLLAAEVFFDSDPGPGHGRPLTGTADDGRGGLLEALQDSTNLAGLTPGVHTANVRVRNGARAW